MRTRKLTVTEAIEAAMLIDIMMSAFEETAPETVAAIGGRDALARRSRMCCFGPVPQLTEAEWCAMSEEYEDNREHGRTGNRGEAPTRRAVARA